MSVSDPLLDILCCPVSHEPLVPLSAKRLHALNELIAQGDIQYIDHTQVETPIAAALISRDGQVIYAVEKGIPVLIPEKGIGTTQFKSAI